MSDFDMCNVVKLDFAWPVAYWVSFVAKFNQHNTTVASVLHTTANKCSDSVNVFNVL